MSLLAKLSEYIKNNFTWAGEENFIPEVYWCELKNVHRMSIKILGIKKGFKVKILKAFILFGTEGETRTHKSIHSADFEFCNIYPCQN
ncbi:MAG: hypothetical protein RBR08_11345 [Desulforegulaceae bacterium]|nr:hypothetical protein [Desulforegulaceae bacterium]